MGAGEGAALRDPGMLAGGVGASEAEDEASRGFPPAELRTRRRSLGLTQEALGRALGVTANTVARWERGALPIGNATVVRLALERLDGAPDRANGPTVPGTSRRLAVAPGAGRRRGRRPRSWSGPRVG